MSCHEPAIRHLTVFEVSERNIVDCVVHVESEEGRRSAVESMIDSAHPRSFVDALWTQTNKEVGRGIVLLPLCSRRRIRVNERLEGRIGRSLRPVRCTGNETPQRLVQPLA